jgi:signal transduction histidine kinase
MAVMAVPLPFVFLGTFVAATTDNLALLAITGAVMVALLPAGAGLAISQYHLYEVDRLLSRALTYVLLSAVVIGAYVLTVVAAGTALSGATDESQVVAVVATLAAASIASPARRRLQDALDRRFNRREFEAVEMMRRYVREPSAHLTVEHVMREALGDRHLAVAYWVDDRDRWVSYDGRPALRGPGALEAMRRGTPIAAITYDVTRVERRLVQAVTSEAQPELENARLRAAIALQLIEVRESRARIVAAQFAERRKIERNLHDGAQQRLLALAMQLRAAEVSGDPERARSALDGAVDELQLAVRELRDLANGLHPAILHDGGLAAALEDLATRTPVPVSLRITGERFPASVEATAWFIACEAVANAVKHAHPSTINVESKRDQRRLILVVSDNGGGGADPAGRGIRGIADRAEAAGGVLTVTSTHGLGTTVRAELPCES